MKPITEALAELHLAKRVSAFAQCVTMAIALPAQTLTTLFSFDGADGYVPAAGLVQATNGDLYRQLMDIFMAQRPVARPMRSARSSKSLRTAP